MADTQTKDSPDFITDNVKAQLEELAVVRSIQAGFPTCKALLIQRLNESYDSYYARQQMPLMFDAMTPFVRDVVGRILKDEPQYEKVSPAFKQMIPNIDNRGTGMVPFMNVLFTDACWAGHSFVLVDHTQTRGATNLADELDQGARPYWVWIRKDQICNFRTVLVDGVIRLGQISIAETTDVPDGRFGVKQVPQWRILTRTPEGATYEIWQKDAKNNPIIVQAPEFFLGADGKPFADIPLVPFYTRQTDFLTSRPLNIELARLVQADYNILSDMEHNHFMSSYPILVGTGIHEPEDLKKQAQAGGQGIMLPDKDMKLDYIAGPGQGSEIGLRLGEKFRREMVVMGNRLFETDQPDRETATAKGLDDAIDINSALQIANNFQDSLDTAVLITQRYLDQKDGGQIILSPNQKQATSTDPNGPPVPPPNQPIARVPNFNTEIAAV